MTAPQSIPAEKLRKLVSEATPGPWRWLGNRKTGMYLATPRGGRRFVMDFVRQGMRGAQPRFQVYSEREGDIWEWNGLMTPASELAALEATYRDDIVGIDHPDAALIALAPQAVALLADCLDALAESIQACCGDEPDPHCVFCVRDRALLARAEGLFADGTEGQT